MSDAAVRDAVVLDDVRVVRGGRTVWSDGSFRVPQGAVVIVIGPNGSGKTTLLQLMLGLVEPATGAVSVLGATPTAGSPRVGYVPQNYTANVGDAIRCRDLVTLGITGRRWGMRAASAQERARVDEALERVGAPRARTPATVGAVGRAAAAGGDRASARRPARPAAARRAAREPRRAQPARDRCACSPTSIARPT